MNTEKNEVYEAYLANSNVILVAPHATMSNETHEDADDYTGLLAKKLSNATGCSYILGVPSRNEKGPSSHDFNNITEDEPMKTAKGKFKFQTCYMIDEMMAQYDKIYVITLHRCFKKSPLSGKIRDFSIDIGTGSKEQTVPMTKLEKICMENSHIIDNSVKMNCDFAATKKTNVIHWFNENVQAVQMEIQEEYYKCRTYNTPEYLNKKDTFDKNYSNTEKYLIKIIKELNKN